MKNRILRLLTFTVALIFCVLVVAPKNLVAAFVVLTGISALISSPAGAFCFVPTLTTAEIISDIFAAFHFMIPPLNYFSTDFSDKQAKKGQQVIAHVASLPVVVDHDDTLGYFNSPQLARDLLEDVPVTMDTQKDVIFRLKGTDLLADRSTKYTETVNGAAFQLGKAMIDSVLRKVNSTNISNQLVCAAANATAAKLRLFNSQLNTQKASIPRFGLVNSAFMTGLLADTVIASGDYFNQLQGDTPLQTLERVMGFRSVSEYPDFQTESSTATGDSKTFTAVAATDLITSTAHGLIAGDRVRFSSTTTLPAGLSTGTNYFVIASGLTADAFKVSATSGGAAVDITDTGTGTHTWFRYDNLNGFFFEKRAVVVASALPASAIELARSRGVPVPMKVETQTDPNSGLTVLYLERFNTSLLDLEICLSVIFGSSVGRQAGAAGAKLDNAGLRIVEA